MPEPDIPPEVTPEEPYPVVSQTEAIDADAYEAIVSDAQVQGGQVSLPSAPLPKEALQGVKRPSSIAALNAAKRARVEVQGFKYQKNVGLLTKTVVCNDCNEHFSTIAEIQVGWPERFFKILKA